MIEKYEIKEKMYIDEWNDDGKPDPGVGVVYPDPVHHRSPD